MGNKRLLIGLAIIAMLNVGTAHAALSTGLELYSSMDTATPYTYASYWSDVSGNGYHSTSDITAYDDELEGHRTAVDFTGGTDRMEVLNGFNDDFNPGLDDYSISLWYNEQTIDSYAYILGKGNLGSETTAGFSIASANGAPQVRIGDGTSKVSVYSGSGDISDSWHHVVATFDRSGAYSPANTVSIYVDNVLLSSESIGTYNVTNSDWQFMIGGQPSSTTHNFEGYMDDVAIYRGVLSSANINTLYNTTSLNENTITSIPAVMVHNFETNLGMEAAKGKVPDDYGLSTYPTAPFNGTMKGTQITVINDPIRGDNVISLPGVTTPENEYVGYGKILDMDADTSFTVSTWFKVDHFVDDETGYAENIAQDYIGGVGWKMYCYAPSNKENAPNGSISCYVQTDDGTRAKLRFAADDGVGGFNDFLNDGGWHHFVMTFDSTDNKLTAYIDGMSSGADGTSNGWTAPEGTVYAGTGSLINDNPLRLGAGYNEESTLEGELDDFAFWTRCLTGSEVLSIFNGASIIPLSVPGDTNNDGIVNATDAEVLGTNWGRDDATLGAQEGDFNQDGYVNAKDASILAANWGDHNEVAGPSSVPEPCTLVLITFGVLMLSIGRRRLH